MMRLLPYQRLGFKCLIIAMSALFIYGCGFHLRGLDYQIPKPLKQLYIQNDSNDYQFISILKSLLSASGIEVVKNKDDATAILVISHVDTTNNMQNITGNLSAGQYLVTYNVTYKVLDKKGHILLSNRVSSASSTYSSNATQQLAANNQADQIKSQLSNQVANNILTSFSEIHQINADDDSNIIIPEDSNSQ